MAKIRADLRSLVENQEVSYLSDKYFSGVTSITIENPSIFAANQYILFGELGSESAEIIQISSITSNTITLGVATSYDHPQSTKITIIDFNQINYYHSSTTTGTLTQLGTSQDIEPDSIFNFYDDTVNTTGYGWFRFFNADSGALSELSNPVPYAGFADNSVKVMLDDFFTQITNRERKLIKEADVLRWINEAYTIARNRLNLSNREYTVPTPSSISVSSGTAEYDLPTAIHTVRKVTQSDGTEIAEIPYEQVPHYNLQSTNLVGTSLATRYYLRSTVIGFAPTPTESATHSLYYTQTNPVLSSYIDYFDLPAGNHYFILDYLLYRATPIIGGNADARLKNFERGLNELIITSHKRGDSKDSWGVDIESLA